MRLDPGKEIDQLPLGELPQLLLRDQGRQILVVLILLEFHLVVGVAQRVVGHHGHHFADFVEVGGGLLWRVVLPALGGAGGVRGGLLLGRVGLWLA
jgi:hypothetical protein